MSLGERLGWLFLALQLGMVLHAQFIPERFFAWAPYGTQARYHVSVSIAGHSLDKQEIRTRYRYAPSGTEARSIHNLLAIIERYERTYGANDAAHVKVEYAINGGKTEHWTWPR